MWLSILVFPLHNKRGHRLARFDTEKCHKFRRAYKVLVSCNDCRVVYDEATSLSFSDAPPRLEPIPETNRI